eukprot:TRINITY_DN7965_c0_g2_i1.p1 TRINITY_DN7965_c0_g2~~TRINITY_DN7965_c0_g2_i1.p1  ORF type:complete len:533 (+),score=74.84 TRINITY_DN7965_c0_g2_i1:158-1756(+)
MQAYISAMINQEVHAANHMKKIKESEVERSRAAINLALKALRKRHALEEGAHGPAFAALSRPCDSQAEIWKEKAEAKDQELQQFYRSNAKLSEQLVQEISECRNLKTSVQEKDALIQKLQSDLRSLSEKLEGLAGTLEEKTKALEISISENEELRKESANMLDRIKKLEVDNAMLLDRLMLHKMQESERLNEINALYEDLKDRARANSLEKSAQQHADGVVRRSESGIESYIESIVPSSERHTVFAHEGGCVALCFQHNSDKLLTGGQDKLVKIWDANYSTLLSTLHGCLGSVLDIAVSGDNKYVLGASSDHKLYFWEIQSGRTRHTLTGHSEKVCATDISKLSNKQAVSAAHDRTIKVWDLNRGYVANTVICHSNCNAVSLTADGQHIYSGHVDGNLRCWDTRSGKLITEVAAHPSSITSVSLSHNCNYILTSGRDNLHNLFDVRTLEVCATFRTQGFKVASNWSRSCISADENKIAAGSADGVVYVWSRNSGAILNSMRGQSAPVLSCIWSDLGKLLVSADKNGYIHIWS